MAKGDHKRMQDQIKAQQAVGQGSQNALMGNLYNSNAQFGGNYDAATGMNMGSYNEIMQGYRNALGGGGAGGGSVGAGAGIGTNFGWDPLFRGAFRNAIGGFNEFADNGGFDNQARQDIRARGVAPIRAVYSLANDNLNRSRSLTGGAPNYAAAQARMAREQAYGLSDMATNVEAELAQMIQQGRLAGLQGLTQAGTAGQGLSTNIDALNQQGQIAQAAAARASGSASAGARLAALNGMTNLYGTTPGMMALTGNQLLQSEQNLLQGQGLQNQLSNMILNGQLGGSQIPGNFASAMQNVNSALAPVGAIAGAFGGGLVPIRGGGAQQFNPYGWSA